MNTAFILLGGNIGDVTASFRKVISLLSGAGEVKEFSGIYRSEPWGNPDQPDFLNMVVELHTTLPPDSLMAFLHQLELDSGRKRFEKNGPRTLDLDLLFYNDLLMNSDLIIPHPRLHLRRFTLLPLAELAPNLVHPGLNLSVNEMLEACSDTGIVEYAGRL